MLDGSETHTRVASMLVEHGLEPQVLDLPPGSLVIHNSMCYHGVQNMPVDAPKEHRLFADYIYKSHRYPKARTQPIPLSWLSSVSQDRKRCAERKMLFDRPMGEHFCHIFWSFFVLQENVEFTLMSAFSIGIPGNEAKQRQAQCTRKERAGRIQIRKRRTAGWFTICTQ
jgi:hypothetical protein